MKIKNIIWLLMCTVIIMLFGGCEANPSIQINPDNSCTENIVLTYEAIMYDNAGNNYATFKGNKFNIRPNKIEQWGYNTDGHWVCWYETSSVVSIEIDGNYIQSCGSTVIFKDSRLKIMPLKSKIGVLNSYGQSEYSINITDDDFENYVALTNWWYELHENGQGGGKVVVIQSQDGYNIGVIEGNNVTWKVSAELPKTTLITIDGMPLYIHRCNFTIIDTALFDDVSS